MKRNRLLLGALIIALIVSCVALFACQPQDEGEFTITVENSLYGGIKTQKSANAGDTVKLELYGSKGYECCDIYVNGSKLEGSEFVMPNQNVVVNVTSVSTASNAYAITVESSDNGVIVADLASANAGDKVTLKAFSVYNRELDYFCVDGVKIDGNSFTMPENDVTVSAVFTPVYEETNVKLSLTVSYQQATSYWYAEYTSTGIIVETVVEDDLIFTSKKGTTSVGMADNIEFIIGLRSSASSLNSTSYKMVVSGIGEYYWQRYSTYFYTVSPIGISVEFEECNPFEQGFLGYRTRVTIPYYAIGTNYNDAYGNLTICPAMRNTTNTLKTGWISYSGMNCNWDNPSTHLLINQDGKFGMNIAQVGYLFTGDELLSAVAGAQGMNVFNGAYTYVVPNSTLEYWLQNMGDITRFTPNEIFFSCGASDLKNKSVLAVFNDMRTFISELQKLTSAKINIVSSIPAVSNQDQMAVIAYNRMVKEYVQTLSNVEYIDLSDDIYLNGSINVPLYGSSTTLSDEGNRALAKQILSARGLYNDTWGAEWGSIGSYVANGAWTYSNGVLKNTSGGANYIYSKAGQYTDFVFEMQITASEIFNGDLYPKFGINLLNGNHSRYYYISAVNLNEEIAGIVEKPYSGYDWLNGTTYTIKDMPYSNGNYVTFKIIKSDNTILFYMNGTLLASTSADLFGDEPVTLGIFSFNTGLTVKNIRFVTDPAQIEKEVG